jgi:hypothetical protein
MRDSIDQYDIFSHYGVRIHRKVTKEEKVRYFGSESTTDVVT